MNCCSIDQERGRFQAFGGSAVVNTRVTGKTVHLSDVHIVSIKQQREVGNYVRQAAEDNSCTAITLICSCLWGEGVSRRGNEAKGTCIRCLSESENGSCQLLTLL